MISESLHHASCLTSTTTVAASALISWLISGCKALILLAYDTAQVSMYVGDAKHPNHRAQRLCLLVKSEDLTYVQKVIEWGRAGTGEPG